jgi:Domain of unknown function (DUF4430)
MTCPWNPGRFITPHDPWCRLAVLASLLVLRLAFATSTKAEEPSAAISEQVETVELTVDYGDGVQKVFRALEWKEGLTVLGALEQAAKHPRGIKFEHRGAGATAFVLSIDDQKNEGAGRNWTYEVSGKRPDKSCGAWVLRAGDKVLWQYALSR